MKWRFLTIICLLLAAHTRLTAQCTTPISSFPYSEDFEANNGGWTTGGTSSDWAWGVPAKPVITGAASGTRSWVTGGLTGSSYNNGENSWLQSPCFDFSSLAHPQISFSVFWETERRFDGVDLQYSTNGGANWLSLGAAGEGPCTSSNWYNSTGITYLGGSAGWSGSIHPTSGSCQGGNGSGRWVTAQHEMESLAGQASVIFRFRFGAGTTCNAYDGFAIDDIRISEATPGGPAGFTYTCGANNTLSFISTVPTCPSGYAWTFGDPASGSNTSTDPNPSHQFSNSGTYIVTLVITYPSGPPSTIVQTVEVLNARIALDQAISCNGGTNGALSVNASGSASPYQYTWNTTPVQHTPNITGLAAGTYIVTVSTATSSCLAMDNFTLQEPGPVVITTLIANPVCNNTNGSISASVTGGTPLYQYNWSNGGTGSSISNLPVGQYTLTVKDQNNCSATTPPLDIIRVTRPVQVTLGNNRSFCPGQTLILNPGAFSSYLWQDNSITPVYNVTQAGTYSVRVTDSDGCIGSASVVLSADCGDIYFPAAFTPNDDGRNDFFGAAGNTAAVTNYQFKIFDRWGQLIFATTNPAVKWAGTLKGKKYNTGAFTWFATYTLNGRPNQSQQGTVLIIR